jgi:hypothetical protein
MSIVFLNIPPCTPSASLGVIHCLSLSGKGYFENEMMTVLFGGATYNSQSSMSTSPQEVEGERACGGDIVRHRQIKPYHTQNSLHYSPICIKEVEKSLDNYPLKNV